MKSEASENANLKVELMDLKAQAQLTREELQEANRLKEAYKQQVRKQPETYFYDVAII